MTDLTPADCDGLQLWIEMDEARALSPEQAAHLAHHLLGCDACRKHQRLVRRIASTLRHAAEPPEREPDLATLDARISALETAARRRRLFPLLALAGFGVALTLVTGKPLPVWLTVGGMGAALHAGFALRALLQARHLRALGRAGADVLEAYRARLRTRIQSLGFAVAIVPLFALGAAVKYQVGGWPRSMRNPAALAVVLGVCALCFTFVLWQRIRELPRLRAELHRLGGR